MRIFNDEGPLMSALSRMADLLWINLLTLICSVPIITAGASITAMHYVLLKMARNEEGYLTRSFFRSFRQNFRQATVIWLLILIFFGVFAADLYLFQYNGIILPLPFKLLFVLMSFLVLCAAVMVFPLLSKFENTIIMTIKNAFLFSLGQFPKILLMLLMYTLPVVLVLLIAKTIPVVILFGISVPAYGAAMLYNKPFERLEERMTDEETE